MILISSFADNSREMPRLAKKISAVLFLGFFAFPLSAFCQADTAWVRHYNGTGNKTDEMRGIAVDDSGNVVVTGYSGDGSSTGEQVTIKYDRNGNQLWLRTYNGVINTGDYPALLTMDKKGNVYVTGGTTSGHDCLTIKYDSDGNQVWAARYYGPVNGIDIGLAVTVDESGNVYVTGISEGVLRNCPNYYFTFYDFVTIKYDSNGNQRWAARYFPPGGDDYWNRAFLIAVDSLSNVYVAGYSEHCQGPAEWVVIKYDSVGSQLWVRSDIIQPWSTSAGAPFALRLDTSGYVYLSGGSQQDSTAYRNYTTAKYYTAPH
ncbi:MAG TPA: hypothetical protein VNL73_07835 [Verrucomicrobiae bacterium]|nr:hypothetical protein [Verrucomicrobiae bacterium]